MSPQIILFYRYSPSQEEIPSCTYTHYISALLHDPDVPLGATALVATNSGLLKITFFAVEAMSHDSNINKVWKGSHEWIDPGISAKIIKDAGTQ